jgi:MFS family permease
VTQDGPSSSFWTPISKPLFRNLWLASLFSNIGTWLQNVAAAWLMTSLAPSPIWVALVQTASTLPVFLLSVPAGALADLVDRRRLLLITQTWMLVAAMILSAITFGGWIGPGWLLGLTFALGIGAALNGPAWQAIVPELVSRKEINAAVVLNSIGFNLARAVGPALSGLLLAVANAGSAFFLNAVSFAGVLWVLYQWKRESPAAGFGATEEMMFGAMRAAFRYTFHAPLLQSILVRVVAFVIGASALWALLPLLAKQELASGALGYGILLGCLGTGSVLCAGLIPRIRTLISTDRQVVISTILFGTASLIIPVLHYFPLVCVCMIAAGAGWMGAMSSFNTSVQTVVPDWVRARALGIYLLVFQGCMAAGGGIWGAVGERWGVKVAIGSAGVTMLAGLITAIRFRLIETRHLDLTPAAQYSEPHITLDLEPGEGPVLVMVEYRVKLAEMEKFAQVMIEMRRVRRRDGAVRWRLFRDPTDPGRCAEIYVVESWAEHLRQTDRETVADREIREAALRFHQGPGRPIATHWISVKTSW